MDTSEMLKRRIEHAGAACEAQLTLAADLLAKGDINGHIAALDRAANWSSLAIRSAERMPPHVRPRGLSLPAADPESGIASRLRDIRERRGWSQSEAAEQVRISREMWGKYERGAAKPGAEVLARLSAIGVNIGALFASASEPAAEAPPAIDFGAAIARRTGDGVITVTASLPFQMLMSDSAARSLIQQLQVAVAIGAADGEAQELPA